MIHYRILSSINIILQVKHIFTKILPKIFIQLVLFVEREISCSVKTQRKNRINNNIQNIQELFLRVNKNYKNNLCYGKSSNMSYFYKYLVKLLHVLY